MDYSPIPSPAFSSSSGSTLPTVVSTFKTNARHQLFDVKNLILDEATSANVKRAKILSIVKAFGASIDKTLKMFGTLAILLGEIPDESIQDIRNICCELLNSLREQALICDKRLHYAADSFKQLVYYERQSLELESKISKLQKDVQKGSDNMRQYAFRDMLKAVECERDQHVLAFANMSEVVCRNVIEQVVSNIQHYCINVWLPAKEELVHRFHTHEGHLVKLGFRGFDQVLENLDPM